MFIIDAIAALLHGHPELAFYLALGGGYAVGKIKIGGQPLGAVLGVLVVGLVVGQADVALSDNVKWILFYLFLFSIGYKCGPQFVSGLRSSGLVQVALTVVFIIVAVAGSAICSMAFGFDAGTGAGLFSGALTASAALGVAGDMVARLPISADQKLMLQDNMTSAFAASYFIGVILTTWFLAKVGPWLMRSSLAADCAELEKELGVSTDISAQQTAYREVTMRGYVVSADVAGMTIREFESGFHPERVFVERVVRSGVQIDVGEDLVFQREDHIGVSGRDEVLISAANPLRMYEVSERELTDIPTETITVIVTAKPYTNRMLGDLAKEASSRGVFLLKHERAGEVLPRSMQNHLERGDVLTLVGRASAVHEVATLLGTADRPTTATNMVVVSCTIVLGALIGLPAFHLGSIELGLGVSVGILIGGLFLGWYSSTRRTISRMPEPVLWLFNSLGLTGFVAITALHAGHSFIVSIQQSGIPLIIGSFIVTILPHMATVLAGRYIFKVHPGIVLGISAGAGTSAPGLAAIQEVAHSQIPTLGYGVTYALGNVLLALGGSLIISLLL